jgi:transcriptional regulator
MTDKETMKLALDALENIIDAVYVNSDQEAIAVKHANIAITTLKEALAQPEQERNFCSRCGKRTPDMTTIHTCTPP